MFIVVTQLSRINVGKRKGREYLGQKLQCNTVLYMNTNPNRIIGCVVQFY